MQHIVDALQQHCSVSQVVFQRPNLTFVTVPKERLLSLLDLLKRQLGFSHLVLLTAVDYLEDDIFQLTYLLCNRTAGLDLGLRVNLPRGEPVMESAHHLWAQLATYQRELKEMFGIDFPGSPHLDEPFVLEGWQGPPPYRRDFDTLAYSEQTYFPRPGRSSNDPAEYMKGKRHV